MSVVKEFLEEEGMDIQGMSDEELEEACEVFTLPSGGYLIVKDKKIHKKDVYPWSISNMTGDIFV